MLISSKNVSGQTVSVVPCDNARAIKKAMRVVMAAHGADHVAINGRPYFENKGLTLGDILQSAYGERLARVNFEVLKGKRDESTMGALFNALQTRVNALPMNQR